MGTKTITIMDDAYILLARSKLSNESFSDALRRVLSGHKKSILKHAGAWKDMTDEEAEELYSNIKEVRKNMAHNIVKRVKSYDLS